jgi:hypothetical protein
MRQLIIAFYTPNYFESGSLPSYLLNQFVGHYTSRPPPDLISQMNKRTFSHVELIFKHDPQLFQQGEDGDSRISPGEEIKESKTYSLLIHSPKNPSTTLQQYYSCITEYLCCVPLCTSIWSASESTQHQGEMLRDRDTQHPGDDVFRYRDRDTYNDTTHQENEEEEEELDEEYIAIKMVINKAYNSKNVNYGFLGIAIDDEAYDAMFHEAVELCKLREYFNFNLRGQMVNFLPKWCERVVSQCGGVIPYSPNNEDCIKGGFCSEIITYLLQKHRKIVLDLEPRRTSPNDLWYGLITEAGRHTEDCIVYFIPNPNGKRGLVISAPLVI